MALPVSTYNIYLRPPYVTVFNYDTGAITNPIGLATGQVQQVYSGCLACSVGDILGYPQTDKKVYEKSFQINKLVYGLINVYDIIFKYSTSP